VAATSTGTGGGYFMSTKLACFKQVSLPRAGADPIELEEISSRFRISLPQDYVKFMLQTDGAEGFLGDQAYLMLYKARDILLINDSGNQQLPMPWMIRIGSNGGGRLYCLNSRANPVRIVAIDDICFDSEPIIDLGTSFQEFITNAHRLDACG
jgi:SMI1 / KNR4 family (SUKH-1)